MKPDDLKKTWRTPGHAVKDDTPVTQVSWNDMVAFCNWLSEQEKRELCYQRDGDRWALLRRRMAIASDRGGVGSMLVGPGRRRSFHSVTTGKNLTSMVGPTRTRAVGLTRSVSLPANPFVCTTCTECVRMVLRLVRRQMV